MPRPKTTMPPVHPGEILREEFLKPMGVSAYGLARSIGVPPMRISNILRGKLGLSADTALRLAEFFGTTAEFWMNLQAFFELETARDRAGDKIKRQVTRRAA